MFDQKKGNIIKHKKLLLDIKIERKVLTFGDIKIGKINFATLRLLYF